MYRFISFFLLLSCFTKVLMQNDDKKEVEWSEDDPRWETKIPNWWDEENFVPPVGPVEERSKRFWMDQGQKLLKEKLEQKLNLNKAKNLVIFIGDGMGLATLMATRSYMSDVKTQLSFEKFPHTGLAKTYCINYQIPDSSCTATAILSGVKTNYGTVGISGGVNLRECSKQQDNATHAHSIFKYAQDARKATGVVTTTRITHATPAAAYAHSSSRYWESNENSPEECDDIAHQLVHEEVGSKLDVAMGGGRRHFLPNIEGQGFRTDGRNLLEEFKTKNGNRSKIVFNKEELQTLKAEDTDKIFGLFASSHLQYKLLSEDLNQPSLTEMVAKSLEVLKKNEKGFVLLVEGGRIDTAHHETSAQLALNEAVEFQKAVQFVKENTEEENTLIVVTSDHSTVLTVGGYMPRGYNILGPGDFSRSDQMWFYSLSYANGPGHKDHFDESGRRKNPRGQNYMNPIFKQPATVSEEEETHAGEDVGVYANGPYSHIFTGVYEQNFIAHAMMYAACIGPDESLKNPHCNCNSGSPSLKVSALILVWLSTWRLLNK